ncbi:MAG: ArnT family glycosyltransferase, partial [Nocardioidaceae bacterium]
MADKHLRPSRLSVGPAHLVAACVLLAVALRAPFVRDPLDRDEAGYLLVARHWHGDGPHLYGDFWVDRPPLLIWYYRLSDSIAGETGVRLLGCLVVTLLVLGAARAGRQLGGTAGAGWAGLVAAALGSSYALAAETVNAELPAAALVMVSCASTLTAVRGRAPSQYVFGLLAGVSAGCALLVKQSFFDGVVFAAVLLGVAGARRTLTTPVVVRVAAVGVVGFTGPLVATGVWAYRSDGGLGELWLAMYGFRMRALGVIAAESLGSSLERLVIAAVMATVSGIVLLVWSLMAARRELGRDP